MNRKEKWMKHLIGLVLTARGEKKWIWGDAQLFCLYADLQQREETVWGSCLYIEVNNRDDSVENNWDDNQFDRRISTRGFSGEGRRRTAWWAVGSSNHKEFILMFGAILRRLFTVSLSVVCVTGHKPILTHLSTKPPNHCVWNKQAYEILGNQTAQHCTDALSYHREFAQTTNQLHASSTGLNERHSGGRWRIVLTSCWHYLTHVSPKAGGQNECERHKCIKQCRY